MELVLEELINILRKKEILTNEEVQELEKIDETKQLEDIKQLRASLNIESLGARRVLP